MEVKIGSKKELIKALVAWSLLIGVFIYGFHLNNEENKLLKENPVQSSAVIVCFHAGKSGRSIEYEFVVNGKVYNGTDSYYPHLEHVYIGDTCEIVYVKSDPEISRASTDDNNLLRIKHRK